MLSPGRQTAMSARLVHAAWLKKLHVYTKRPPWWLKLARSGSFAIIIEIIADRVELRVLVLFLLCLVPSYHLLRPPSSICRCALCIL